MLTSILNYEGHFTMPLQLLKYDHKPVLQNHIFRDLLTFKPHTEGITVEKEMSQLNRS